MFLVTSPHSETIWKPPKSCLLRTKALLLLRKSLGIWELCRTLGERPNIRTKKCSQCSYHLKIPSVLRSFARNQRQRMISIFLLFHHIYWLSRRHYYIKPHKVKIWLNLPYALLREGDLLKFDKVELVFHFLFCDIC